MDYIVSGRAPDIATAVVPHVVNPDGSVSPQGSAVAPVPYALANLSFTSAGDTTLVTASGSTVIRVYRLILTTTAPVDVLLKDGASTVLATLRSLGSAVLEDPLGRPLFALTAGNALVANLSAAVSVGGALWFTQG